MPRFVKFFFVALITICSAQAGFAQKTKTKKTTATQKYKVPPLVTVLGTYKDSITLSTEDAGNVIALPLKIYDDKKVAYTVSSYQFLYKKKGVTEDEQTGKVSPASSISSNSFKATPLPEIWINTIREQLKPGEELYFFDVIARDAQGRVMYAPSLKILTQ